MKDTICKNLEFKTFTFVTLLGTWLWILKSFISYLYNPSNIIVQFLLGYVFICGFFISFVIFYSLINLGMMLMYASVYQIEEHKEKLSGLETLYNKRSMNFFGWWPVALISIPGFIWIASIGEKMHWYYVVAIFAIYEFFAIRYFFKKIYSAKDLFKHLKPFGLSLLGYIFIFGLIISFSNFLQQIK